MIPIHSLPPGFDIQGHRGCRGLLPENTLEAFAQALELGVTTLEMDLVISKDHKVVVSHEPYFSHEISTSPDGISIEEKDEKSHNIYLMNYDEVRKYDVGKKFHPRFPYQKKQAAFKPLFEEVVDLAEEFCRKHKRIVYYNVEIKSTVKGDSVFHPEVSVFTDLVVEVLKRKRISSRTMIQSFDVRALQYLHKKHPHITTSYLIEENIGPEASLSLLGFKPKIYSPEFILVDKEMIALAKELSMKVIPWTVNTSLDIQTLLGLGVDGIITDYPNLFVK